jgi:hypothetical protein
MKLGRVFLACISVVSLVACASGDDSDSSSTAGAISAGGGGGGDKPDPGTPNGDCGGGGDDDDEPGCPRGYVCKPNAGEANSLMPHGTCQKAAPGDEGSDCTGAPTSCKAPYKCSTDNLCAIPDFGTEGGMCDGRTETPCADSTLECVHPGDSWEGTCQKKKS